MFVFCVQGLKNESVWSPILGNGFYLTSMQRESQQVTETAQTVALATLQNSVVIEFKLETWQKWD